MECSPNFLTSDAVACISLRPQRSVASSPIALAETLVGQHSFRIAVGARVPQRSLPRFAALVMFVASAVLVPTLDGDRSANAQTAAAQANRLRSGSNSNPASLRPQANSPQVAKPRQAGNAEPATATGDFFGLRSLLKRPENSTPPKPDQLLASLPTDRLTKTATNQISEIARNPSLYRRLKTQTVNCDEEMFLFLVRKPEAMIGLWDLMGITNVRSHRVSPFKFAANDGSGTRCEVDLLYGDRHLHLYVANGIYDGQYTQKPVRGRGLFILRSKYHTDAKGNVAVTGTLQCYVKLDSLGADLLARSFGGLIGKSADHNFAETAGFMGQVYQASQRNPDGMLEMVDAMSQVDPTTRTEFARQVMLVHRKHLAVAQPHWTLPARR